MIRIFTILFLLLPQLSLQQEEGHLHPTESFLLTFESEAEQQEGGVGGEEEGLDTFMMKLIKNGENESDKNCVLFILQSCHSHYITNLIFLS